MIPLAVPNLNGREREYLNQCIDTTFVSSVGSFVERLEALTAELSGTGYGVATSSGTTGLHLALTGYGVGRDDLVIIPSFTFIATANAVAHCGAMPWFMDIEPDTWTMDATQLERELTVKTEWQGERLIHKETGRRVAAIMPVYTLGNIPDMDWIRAIAKKYKLPLIADAAAAIGATYKGKKTGELADCTVFSFNGNKTVTAGGGGAVVGDDEAMMKRLKHLSTTARVSAEYDFDMVGFNYRMTNIQAAVGCAQLERADELVERKRQIRRMYREAFDGMKGISPIPKMTNGESACRFSGIVVESGNLEAMRRVCTELKQKGIEARTFWKPVHLQKPYEQALRADSLAITEGVWDKILTLPCSTTITDEELESVIKAVKELV